VLGLLYGAGAKPSLDANRIFARWLQKKLILTTADGKKIEPTAALGPDRQVTETDRDLSGRADLLGENGTSGIASADGVTLKRGRAYLVEVRP
jgi:hypothetical protein